MGVNYFEAHRKHTMGKTRCADPGRSVHHWLYNRKTLGVGGMRVDVQKITDESLMRRACAFTINAESKMTLPRIYRCEHSPMRTQMFVVEMYNIPTFVSVHFVRHKHGVEHFVKSNRDDRNGVMADRLTPVNHMMFLNAQALVNMARKRLCLQAHTDTVQVMMMVKDGVRQVDSALAEVMVPECIYRNGCHELRPCGFFERGRLI
jgi:hypothetical protein